MNNKTYLTIDLDFFDKPKQFKEFLNIFKFPSNNIDFQRNHHSLTKNIIDSGCTNVINIDRHDDLNCDYFYDKILHCGNWPIYLMYKELIKSYTWIYPKYPVKCEYYSDVWKDYNILHINIKKMFGLKKFYEMDYIINNVGVCISPNYHINDNCRIITEMFIEYCDKKNITLNRYKASTLYNMHKKMLMTCTDDDKKRLLYA